MKNEMTKAKIALNLQRFRMKNEMTKAKIALNLQRFSEPEPLPNDPEIQITPDPTPPTDEIMPSGMAPEAWKNVEDMLVTLSNNIRVQMSTLNDKVDDQQRNIGELRGVVENTLSEVQRTMNEFRQLLSDATIEVPEPEAEDNEREKDKQHGKAHQGYTARRRKGDE